MPKSLIREAAVLTAIQPHRCEQCGLRRRAEARPDSLLARLWRWHTGWCPGWKSYQRWLAEENTKQAVSAL
jgi:hypothetical protein